MAAAMGLSDKASRNCSWTSSATEEPARSSLEGSNAGRFKEERVAGTKT